MIFFHIASNKNAEAILKEGFRNGKGYYLTDRIWGGVWISDKPFDDEHLSDDVTLLAIEIPEEDISDCESVEEGKPYREWLVDDKILNSYGPPLLVDDYEDDEIVPHPDGGAFMGDFDMSEFLWMDKPPDWLDK